MTKEPIDLNFVLISVFMRKLVKNAVPRQTASHAMNIFTFFLLGHPEEEEPATGAPAALSAAPAISGPIV